MDFNGSSPFPEGVISFLDTDLYKLTMQCAVLKYFPDVQVTYAFKNRTPEKKLSREAFRWLQIQINSWLFQPCARKPLTVRQSWGTLLSQTTNCTFSKQLAPT
jgi:nicotinate phosphoribosyltransferase